MVSYLLDPGRNKNMQIKGFRFKNTYENAQIIKEAVHIWEATKYLKMSLTEATYGIPSYDRGVVIAQCQKGTGQRDGSSQSADFCPLMLEKGRK